MGQNMTAGPGNHRMAELSLMRAAACIGIVMLHTVFAANEYFSASISTGENLLSRMIVNNMMWAVPTFIMVTGVLQLDPGKSLPFRKLYGRYVLRILIALAACCLLFRCFDMIMDGEPVSLAGFLKAFSELITARCWGHLWYLYLLIGLYVLMPFYRKLAADCTDRELLYLCGAYFLFVSIVPMIEGFGINIGFYISESIIYPLYLFLGYMIRSQRLRISTGLALVLVICSTLMILALDVMKYRMNAGVPGVFFGYSSPLVIFQSAGVFAILCNDRQGQRLERSGRRHLLQIFDECTFGIYLIHMVFIRLAFRYLQLDPYIGPPAVVMLSVVVEILLISFSIVWLLRKVPGIRWVL